jgi:hypothetical protein
MRKSSQDRSERLDRDFLPVVPRRLGERANFFSDLIEGWAGGARGLRRRSSASASTSAELVEVHGV